MPRAKCYDARSYKQEMVTAVITKLCKKPRSYQVTTKDGVTYRKMQAHLKPYKPDDK